MLVLSRKIGQRIVIAENVVLTVISVSGQRVKLGVDAPRDIGVRRAELSGSHDQLCATSTDASDENST